MADVPVVTHENQAQGNQSTPAAGNHDSLEALVWRELGELYDPEIPVSVVELGLIYAMRTAPLPGGGNRVEVLMTVTSPACGMSEVLRTEADARLRRLPNVSEVEVAVTFDPPWTPELMSEEARLLLNL
jgi:metal-sulfur cluster biosynthetic enzyme